MILNGHFYPDYQWLNKPHRIESTGKYAGECFYNYLVGNRRGGKSVGVGIFTIADFLIYGYRSALIRRFLKNFEDKKKPAMETFFQRAWPYRTQFYDVVKGHEKLRKLYPLELIEKADFEHHELSFESHTAFIDGELFSYPVALNVFDDYKSSLNFENVYNIIYDEFMSENTETGTKLQDEVGKMYNVIDTIARNRDDALKTTGVVFISNAVTGTSEFYTEHNIDRQIRKDTKRLYRPKEGWTWECVKNEIVSKELIESPYGKILKSGVRGREYLGYSQSNEVRDDKAFVQVLRGNMVHVLNVRYNNKVYAFRKHNASGCYYFTDRDVDKKQFTIALTLDDHTIDTQLINNVIREDYAILKAYYRAGYMRFSSQRCKNVFLDIYRYM